MLFARHRILRPTVALFLVFVVCCSPLLAQQQQKFDFSKSAPIFPQFWKPYESVQVQPPKFTNSARISDLIRDGVLKLSLDDAIALALENNLDLLIARYNLPIADTDVLRTKSGAAVRGVNTGVVQGTPGGGVGSIGSTTIGGGSGGTSAAAGGAGTGAAGIVSSTLGVGPTIDSFDPILTSSLGIQHANIPQSNTVSSGVPVLSQNTGTANFTYNQGFATGTLATVTFNNSRLSSNSPRTFLVPQLSSNFLVQFRQHLLQGFGTTTNRRFILIARNNREIADIAFRQQVTFTVTQIETLYWNLVAAYEDVRAKQRAVALSQQLEANNRRQVQVGTMAEIEVVNAQSQVATSQQNLILSQTNLQLQQLLMKNALTRNTNDPVIASAGVVPTDTMQLPATEPVVPIQDLINEALSRRPELAQSRIDLKNREISKAAARNAVLPAIDLVANYGGAGLAGDLNPFFASGTTTPTTAFTGGYFDALTGMTSHPTYFVGFNVNIPIMNRAAQADQRRSQLEYRQAQARLQQIENTIGIEVRNAQFALLQNRARVDAAKLARTYAAQVLDAEQKKLAQGLSTTFNVLQDITLLDQAESNLVTAMTSYEVSRVQLDVVTGRLLETLGIDLADAQAGVVNKLPHVPGVVAAPPTPATPTSTPQQQPQQ